MKIYLDVDDTLADFKGACIARGVPEWSGSWYTTPRDQWTEEQLFIQSRTQECMDSGDFWPSLKPLPGAFELIAAAALRGPTKLLTATPEFALQRDRIETQKRLWALHVLHFRPNDIIVCRRHEKVQYAGFFSPEVVMQNLLIDDAEQNCEEWRAAGGRAIHFTDAASAIEQLKRIK